MKLISIILILIYCSSSWAETRKLDVDKVFLRADFLAINEDAKLQKIYFNLGKQFDDKIKQEGNYLLNEYSYLAYRGSVASMTRLCVMYGYGIGTKPETILAWAWCKEARSKGEKYLWFVSKYVFDKYEESTEYIDDN